MWIPTYWAHVIRVRGRSQLVLLFGRSDAHALGAQRHLRLWVRQMGRAGREWRQRGSERPDTDVGVAVDADELAGPLIAERADLRFQRVEAARRHLRRFFTVKWAGEPEDAVHTERPPRGGLSKVDGG
jgi:hypothetical protein